MYDTRMSDLLMRFDSLMNMNQRQEAKQVLQHINLLNQCKDDTPEEFNKFNTGNAGTSKLGTPVVDNLAHITYLQNVINGWLAIAKPYANSYLASFCQLNRARLNELATMSNKLNKQRSMMENKKIRLNETQLKRIIKESVSRILAEEFYGYGENGEMETYEGVHGRLDQALSELLQEHGFGPEEIPGILNRHSTHNSKLQVVRDAIASKIGGDPDDAMKEATKIVLAWKKEFKDENAKTQSGSVWLKRKEYGSHFLNSSPDDVK